jgi:hypothetical protein
MDKQKKDPLVNNRRRGNNDSSLQTQGRGKIEFSLFLQNVLNFQLKNHEKLLRPLVNAFKMRDRDSDGIVDE